MRRLSKPLGVVLFVGLAAGISGAQQIDPKTLPARDAHQEVVVAANPLTDQEHYQVRFGKKHPALVGVLALELVVRNDNARPIRLDLAQIRLLLAGESRQQLEPLPVEVVVNAIANRKKGGPNPVISRLPIPIKKPPKPSKEWTEVEAALRPLVFEWDVLPPKSTLHGFLFFDLSGRYELLKQAQLYLPSLKFMDNNEELFYFEVDLSKAARK